MSDETIVALLISTPLVLLLVYDIDTARLIRKAERVKPYIPFLTGVKILVYGVCIGALIAVVLGLNSALFNLTGLRLVAPPLPFVLIYLAVVSSSVGLYVLRRIIRRQVPEVDE